MELFSPAWFSALLAIILIDLVLAGDNAIVIALAARNLPPHLQKKAILWGTFGAIAVRSVMTVGVVWLLKVPGLMLVGGLGLVWIAYKLLADQGEDEHDGPVATTFWGAMKTIIIADALMGVDNVLFSIDYPYESTVDACRFIEDAPLDEATRHKICHENARQLFKL